jgi:hypothetical protein
MSEKKSASKRPERLAPASPDSPWKSLAGDDLRAQRTAFVSTFFKKGAELTEELLRENERLVLATRKIEAENAALRKQLKTGDAIREAHKKIDDLESERETLQSQFSQAEAVTNQFARRHSEIEEELSNLANLYIATFQLHAAIRLPAVVKNMRELLAQLVGARSHAVYVIDEKRRMLVPVSCDGVELEKLPRVQLAESTDPPKGGAAVLERVFLTGVAHIEEGPTSGSSLDSPAACLPMRIEERAIGVIAVYDLLPQKERFVPVDFELFRMVAAHGATALIGAMLYAQADGKLPGLDMFRDLRDQEPRRGRE